MLGIINFIINNIKYISLVAALIIILSLTGGVTESIRSAKKGLKEAVTPLGLGVLIIIVLIIYSLAKKLGVV